MTSSSDYVYFILTRKPEYPGHVNAGHICYMRKSTHRSQLRISQSPKKLHVYFMDACSLLDYEIDVCNMAELSEKEADLLVALPDDRDRLKWYREEAALHRALTLTVDTEVIVEEDGQRLNGIIRFIGQIKLPPHYSSPLSGMFFGIELQGDDRGKGNNNGTYEYKKLFPCEKDCGVIVPFSRLRPVEHRTSSPADLKPQTQAESQTESQTGPQTEPQTGSQTGSQLLNPADRVSYFVGKKLRRGMVVEVKERKGEHYVWISTDQDEDGKTGGEDEVPLKDVMKGEVPAAPESMVVDTPMVVEPSKDETDFSVSSLVEVVLGKGNSYGIIRWIGSLPERKETMAGLELEEELGVSDGTFKDKRFFDCPPKRALFVKLSSCRPDSRFMNRSEDFSEKMEVQEDTGPEMERYTGKPVPPIGSEQIDFVLIGRMKGIQGHCNSCYMDAALFSLFSCSSVLDSMLFKSTTPQDAPIQRTLLYDIVNPLRSKGFVEGRHIMKLRQQLQKHGYSHSFTTDEKDPEEFLTVIMHHILALDPLLKLSAGGKVQESFCYQIFLDQNQLVLPTVQQLLEHSFHCAGLKLAEVPSCLILQMPRFGKKFKMFDKIVPSLELDITDLLSEGPQQCMLCGQLAERECIDCFGDPVFSQKGFKVFCGTCSAKVHSHPKRQSHKPVALDVPKGYHGRSLNQTLTRDKLELFAVLCIETSHYVSFIKHGPKSQDWIFFDSMADRQGEIDGFNIPEVRSCPEVGAYLEMSPAELANQVPRDMRGVAKRLFCDAYMYLYQSKNMCLYR